MSAKKIPIEGNEKIELTLKEKEVCDRYLGGMKAVDAVAGVYAIKNNKRTLAYQYSSVIFKRQRVKEYIQSKLKKEGIDWDYWLKNTKGIVDASGSDTKLLSAKNASLRMIQEYLNKTGTADTVPMLTIFTDSTDNCKHCPLLLEKQYGCIKSDSLQPVPETVVISEKPEEDSGNDGGDQGRKDNSSDVAAEVVSGAAPR